MKNTIIILVAILVGVFAVLTFMDKGGEYSAEKYLWKVNKSFEEIAKDPEAVPDASFDKILAQYQKFTKKYSDSKLEPLGHIFQGRVYFLRKEYDKALEKYDYVATTYKDKETYAVKAIVEMGKVYEAKSDIKGLLGTYERMLKEHTLTPLGLKAPLLISKVFERKNDKVSAQRAYNDAELHYKKLMNDYPNTIVGFEAMRYLAVCNMYQGKQKESINVLGDLLMESAKTVYLSAQRAVVIMKTINTTAIESLDNIPLAVAVYNKFIYTYTEHPLVPNMKKFVEQLQEIKAKGLSKEEVLSGKK